jgi:hypothetical protein
MGLCFVFHRAYTAMVASAESNAQEIKENINLMRSDIEVKKTVFDVLPKKSQKLSMLFEISNQFTNIVDVFYLPWYGTFPLLMIF